MTPLHFHATLNVKEREFCKNFMISYQNNSFYPFGKFWLKAHFIRESSQVCLEYRRQCWWQLFAAGKAADCIANIAYLIYQKYLLTLSAFLMLIGF